MFGIAMQAIIQQWPSLLLVLLLVNLAINYFNRGLQKYPGPILARVTDWWRVLIMAGREHHDRLLKIHRKHGDIVRVGPNVLSFGNPQALSEIYSLKGLVKSPMYLPHQFLDMKGNRLSSLFSATDEGYHNMMRRAVSNSFSMSTLVQYEPAVDAVIERLLKRTEQSYASKNTICDLAEWLRYFAFDVISEITWSSNPGFLDQNKDVDGILRSFDKSFSYVAVVGQMPFLDLVFAKNPLLVWLSKLKILNPAAPLVNYAHRRLSERKTEVHGDGIADEKRNVDLMSKFLKAKATNSSFDDSEVLTMCLTMAGAGSDTTAISIGAVLYYLIRNLHCYQRLQSEIDDAFASGLAGSSKAGQVSWAEAQKLAYLDVCIKEGLRLAPAFATLMERVVPPGGAKILGHGIPGGTFVGCNPWVIGRSKVFEPDVDAFRPERWLEASPDSRKIMEGSLFHFGGGPRTCIGKNIALLEMYKTIPTFLRHFYIALENPEQEWQLYNALFLKQKNFRVRFQSRNLLA